MPEPPPGDPFGRALLDHLRQGGDAGMHVYERDDGYVATGSAAPYFAPADRWHPLERRALEWVHGAVLDVGAGAGRMALWLQGEGHDVLALDISPGAVEVCRSRGVRRTHLGSVASLNGGERFGTLLMMGNNLGLLGSPEAAPALLDALGAVAAPGAALLGSLIDPYRTDDPVHLAYHERNRRAGRPAGRIRLRTRYADSATPWFDLLWSSPEELRGLVAGSGWAVADLLDDGGPVYWAALRRE